MLPPRIEARKFPRTRPVFANLGNCRPAGEVMVCLATRSEPSPEHGADSSVPTMTGDYVERALLAARDLIESTATRHRRELAQDSWAGKALGQVPVAEVVDTLVDGAERTVSVVLSGGEEQSEVVCSALARPARGGRGRRAVRLL